MIKNNRFIQQLFKELTEWVDIGVITPEQKKKIENLYSPSAPAAEKSEVTETIREGAVRANENINLSRVIIGLATLCLAIGIIIFYASNWRKMPPAIKLVQIFILIISAYGGAYWFLQSERRFSLVGRSLLLVGMISYGTGIMLVAQVYHISSHPTNGILAWGIGAFAISILMKEKYGIYLSMILFIIWDVWEYSYFGNPAYLFIIPVLLTGWFCWKNNDRRGITGTAILAVLYFFQISFYFIDHYAADGPAGYLLITFFIIAGGAMQRGGSTLKKNPFFKNTGTIFQVTGWIAYTLPLLLIDHIQPETSGCVVAWASAILAVSVIIKEKNGYYISAALFFVWSVTSRTPAYGYVIPVIILSLIFFKENDDTGLAVSAASLVYYYFLITIKLLPEGSSEELSTYFIVMLQFPLTAFLITAGKNLAGIELLRKAGELLTVAGWFSFLVPFVVISWPYDMQTFPLLMKFGEFRIQTIEYIIMSAASFGCIFLLHKKNEKMKIILPVVLLPVLVFFLPFNHTATRMISTHLAAILFVFILLYYSYTDTAGKTFEKTFAFIFTAALIIIKGAGFISYSVMKPEFKLAYLIGFILFVTVCFLVNSLVHRMLSDNGTEYPVRAVDAICATGVWISIYLASFEVGSQQSIFTAESLVIKMTVIFIALSVILYYMLFKKVTGERVILYLSLIIFASSGITLFAAGPDVPWEIYSITFNLLLFVTSAVFMYYSTIVQSKKILNFATAGIIIHVFTRYFDLFWDMFSGSLLFIITGIIGLAGGYILEKKRERLTELIDASSGSEETGRIK